MREFKEICVCRIDRIGDLIMTTPILKAIRLNWPKSRITLLASNINSKVLKNSHLIDKIIVINHKDNLFNKLSKIKTIRKQPFDLFINLSPSNLSFIYSLFSRSNLKSTMIFLSRYHKILSKIPNRILAKFFFDYVYLVDRFSLYKKNSDFHQIKMMFNLIKMISKKRFPYTKLEIPIKSNLEKKIKKYFSKKIIIIHLSYRWINKYYDLNKLKNLFEKIEKNKKFNFFLTTEKINDQNFYKIIKKYKYLNTNDFTNRKKIRKKIIRNNIFVLDSFKYNDWISVIKQSYRVITPESGCVHVGASFGKHITVIYNYDNLPEYIYKEYKPWKTPHTKLVFGPSININKKIIKNLN